MKIKLHNIDGAVVKKIDVRDDVFGVPMRAPLVHQVVVAQLANARQGTSKVKNRSQVSGGGRKPRPQKHSGLSRQGSIRSPLWVGGGNAFGPTPRSYRHRTPNRMRRLAIRMALSDKIRDSKLIVIDNLGVEDSKTKTVVNILKALNVKGSVLLSADGTSDLVVKAARNIPELDTLPASLLNTVDIINHDTLIMTLEALQKVQELWAGRRSRLVEKVSG